MKIINGFIVFILIILALFITTVTANTGSGIFYAQLNNNTLDNGSLNNYFHLKSTAVSPNYFEGILAEGIRFDNNFALQNLTLDGNQIANTRTIEFWYNSTNNAYFPLYIGDGTANNRFYIWVTAAGLFELRFDVGGGNIIAGNCGSAKWNNGQWQHFVFKFGANGWICYQNNTAITNDVQTSVFTNAFDRISIGGDLAGASTMTGIMDNVYLSDHNYTVADVAESWNGGAGLDFNPPVASESDTINLSDTSPINAYTSYTTHLLFNGTGNFSFNESTINCSLIINGTNVETKYYGNGTNIVIDYSRTLAEGHYSWYFSCLDNASMENSTNKTLYVDIPDPNITFSNYVNYTGLNYTRNLTYSINISFCSSNSTILRYINGTLDDITTISCTGDSLLLPGNYTHSSEGGYNISFFISTQRLNETQTHNTMNRSFISDLYNPTVEYLNISFADGFNNSNGTITLICSDTIMPIMLYNLTLNNVNLHYANVTNGTTISNETQLTAGTNTAIGVCSDFFGNTSDTYAITVYIRSIYIIDEIRNNAFNVTNLTRTMVYFDDNSTSYDFKAANTNHINFTSATTNKLRFEFAYSNGDVITRYVDASLDNGDLRVCANTDPTTHYEQIIVSATQRKVSLKNVYSNCVIAEDYTRFAYQDSMVLKAYTINSLYYLYTYDDNDNKVYLASMDGSISTYYNIDVLEFKSQGYNLDITGEVISFSRSGNVLTIRYQNMDNDSISTKVTITRVNDSSVFFTATETADPNGFYMYFDYSTLTVNESTLFKIEVEKTDINGVVSTMERFFNTGGKSGIISSGLAFTIAVLLTFFGLTLTISRLALGWFGIVVMLGSIVTLSFAVSTWYSTMLMAINVIILAYIVILFTQQNYSTVT